MSIFHKKPKPGTPAFRTEMAERIAARRLKYAVERTGEEEIVIGRSGYFNIRDGLLIVTAGTEVIFRCRIADMDASDLMSLGGTILIAPDLEHGGRIRTIVVYYVEY